MKCLNIIFLIFSLMLTFCNSNKKEENSNIALNKSIVLSVISEPPGSDIAANGTGIVVDKENGLILTARHGVYHGDTLNYKNKNLFKNILITNKDHKIQLDGYVAHFSNDYDLAIIKVNYQFSSEAVFISTDFLKIRDEIEFWGYPGGQYGTYGGYIANIKEDYLNLDMTIVGGMSGGPVIVPDKGIVGMVLLKQEIGGNALKGELIKNYLKQALPKAKKFKIKSYSLCLKKIRFNEKKSKYNREKEPKLYFYLSVNSKKILETNSIEVTDNEMQWNDCTSNKFKLTIIPGDRIEFKVYKEAWSILKDSVFIEKIFERLPQEGLPDFESEVIIDGNSIFFENV